MSNTVNTSEFSSANLEIVLSAADIKRRVGELGDRITLDYAGKRPHLICVLKGAATFLSDLMRSIDLSLSVDYIAVSSYGKGTSTSGEVKMLKDLDGPLEGRDIIIVEDILDTGLTLSFLHTSFRNRGAASIRIATLLNKPERRRVEVHADYVGFEIPDFFAVGYGLDYDERYRNLPFIALLKPSS